MYRSLLQIGIFVALFSHLEGAIVSSTDSVDIIAPPESVDENTLTSDVKVRVFQEQNHFALPNLTLDVVEPGIYDDEIRWDDIVGGQVSAGTLADIFFVHANGDSSPVNYEGSITFGMRPLNRTLNS